jgi:hypothetical protein
LAPRHFAGFQIADRQNVEIQIVYTKHIPNWPTLT